MSISSREFLRHIRDEIKFVLKHTETLDFNQFYEDEVLKRSIVRSLEIIGEAVKNIDLELQEAYPQVEWRALAKTRDKLIHHYFGVDYEIVWNIIVAKLPGLLLQIEEIIQNNSQEEF